MGQASNAAPCFNSAPGRIEARPHSHCEEIRGERWPSRLVETAAEDRLSFRRRNSHKVGCGSQRLPVDQRMRLECGVCFRQLRTCRRTRSGQLYANFDCKTATFAGTRFEGARSFTSHLFRGYSLGWLFAA